MFEGSAARALIGRDDVLTLVERRWNEARLGRGELLLITGEAGIGKSRLLRELASRVGAEASVITAGAYPRDAEAPGGLVLSLSEGFRRAGLGETADALRERLLRDDIAGDAARRRRVLVGDLVELLAHAASAAPLLVSVEDLHWADELSLEILERLAAELRHHPLLLAATYRSDELLPNSWLGGWRSRLLTRRAAEEVRLERLDVLGVAALAEAIMGVRQSSDFIASLLERSDGIPLHIEELVALGSVKGSSNEVPGTVAEAVGARAATLTPASRAVLDAGCVVGRSFDIDLLEVVVGQPSEEIDRALVQLVDSHLIVADGLAGRFVFRHALICDAIYAELSPYRRRALHAAVARAADRFGLGNAYISDQYERANDSALAYSRSIAGAAEAVRISAHREAARLFRRAQRTVPNGTDAAERAALDADLARELAAIDDSDGAAANLESAIALYRSMGDGAAAARLVPGLMASRHLLGASLGERTALAEDAIGWLTDRAEDRAARAGLLGALAAAHMLDRRLESALAFGREAQLIVVTSADDIQNFDLALTIGSVLVFAGDVEGWQQLEFVIAASTAAGLEGEAARGYRMIGSCASVLVEYQRALRWIAEGLEFTARTEHWNDHGYLLSHLAHVYWAGGHTDDARSAASRASVDGHGITTRITALYVLGYVALCSAEFDRARELLSEALALGEQMGELQRVSPALWGLAEVALNSGDLQLANVFCERGLVESGRVEDAAYLFPFVVTGTRTLLGLHEPLLARAWLDRCAALIRRRNIPGTLPCLDHAQALIELSAGRTGIARQLLESALERWCALGREWEASRARIDLAHCAIRSRRPADAARLVSEVRERATLTGWTLLDSLADLVHLGPELILPPLSSREAEVAILIATGATNREIAAALSISLKTAASHVEHILAKLEVGRRAEVAAWVTRASISP